MWQKHYYLQLDTETCGSLESAYVYDLGMIVTDRNGYIYEKFNIVVGDVYYGMQELMLNAYYADKLPQYEEEIANGTRKVMKWDDIFLLIRDIMKAYPIRAVIAHNCRFDKNALQHTHETCRKKVATKYLFPYGTEFWCTLAMARQTIGKQKKYRKYCEDFGYLTANGRPRLTAEILYRYYTGDEDFIEKHTGLEDVYCELVILMNLLQYHQKICKTYYKPR